MTTHHPSPPPPNQILNRLKSICYDSAAVNKLCDELPNAALVANLRCGAWYCKDPNVKTCYFKSTDGHNKQWDFNTRRLNMDLLRLVYSNANAYSAVIIVDATANKRKVYPDALSKTIPIWAYIINKYFNNNRGVSTDDCIRLPRFIQEEERTELIECLKIKGDKWILELETNNTMEEFVGNPQKQMIPMFVSYLDPFNEYEYKQIISDNNIPLICLSVGNNDGIQIDREYTYFLGAGDDEEMWSCGLTCELFWNNPNMYLECVDDEEIKTKIIKKCAVSETLKMMDDRVIFISDPDADADHPLSIRMRIVTNVATFNKRIMKSNNGIIDIIHKTNIMIMKIKRHNITQIQFICNNFKVSLAILVSIMINFREFSIDDHDDTLIISKEYIRKIISYVYRFSGSYQMPRDFCKQLNKYYIINN